MKYDVICIGAGLYGSVWSYYATHLGKKCLVIDKSAHIGGNCYTRDDGGINVHEFGPHIAHTSDERIWNFFTKFARFNHFVNRPKVMRNGKFYSFPINLFTLYQVFGVKTPEEAKRKLAEVRVPIQNPRNLEEWCLSQVGEEIYDLFIRHYTAKQWKTDPKNLPTFIIKRLPIRLTFDDNYFDDHHQGIPIGGYTRIFEQILEGTEVQVGVDFFSEKSRIRSLLKSDGTIVYTGKPDELFEFDQGELPYRNLRFDHERLEIPDFQGNAVVNYNDPEVAYTRITEHKHFEFGRQSHTVISREYPIEYSRENTPFYPINTDANNELARKYRERAKSEGYVVGGRLGKYQYMDMCPTIGMAMHDIEKHFNVKINEKGDLE